MPFYFEKYAPISTDILSSEHIEGFFDCVDTSNAVSKIIKKTKIPKDW